MRLVAPRTRLHAVLALLFAALALGCIATSARAEAWGQVESLPFAGGEADQIVESRLVKFAAGSDGSYYVLTGDSATGEYELKRYDEGKLQASVAFKRPKEEEETSKVGTEGENAILAVDPSRDRVFVLLVYERRDVNAKEEKEEEKTKKPVFPLDEEMSATGSLYAFEYKSATKELVSKTKEGLPAPQLARSELHGQGEAPKEALLDPRGIAVDPANGDLAISGNQDEESNAKVEAGAEKQCRAAIQFVTVESGTKGEVKGLSPSARYVDSAGKVLFGKTGCGDQDEEEAINQAPASPVFAPDGTLLGYGEDELVGAEVEGIIWQLAPSGADTHAPGEVTMTPKELFVSESIPAFEPSVGVAEEPADVMSLVSESSTEGTIYLGGGGAINKQPAPAVLRYSHPTGGEPSITLVGWTAGGTTNENAGPEHCDLHKAIHEPTMLGGLSGAKRGLLAFTYYIEKLGPGHEEEVPRAEVVEFGEGGSTTGCPTVSVSTPSQSYHGEPTNKVPANSEKPLAITSVLGKEDMPAAGAKSVEWNVKFTPAGGKPEPEQHYKTEYEFNGLHEEVPGYGTALELELNIARAGAYEIIDVVHSDDLGDEVAQPALADKLTVTPGELVVTPRTPVPATVRAHEEEALLSAALEVPGEEKLSVEKVVWEFGDGSPKVEETTLKELAKPAELSIKHAFNRCASAKCKIALTVEVKTAEGTQRASKQLEITVTESKAEEQKRHEEQAAAERKTEEEAAAQKAAEQATAAAKQAKEAAEQAAAAAAAKAAEEEAARNKAKAGVAGYIASFAGSSLSVSAGGTTSVTITCPTGGSCSGTLTLQTLTAVAASSKKHAAKKILTLASGAFSLSAGSKAVTLHLSATARALLSHSHGALRVKLTILSRGSGTEKNSLSTHVVTLRLVKKK